MKPLLWDTHIHLDFISNARQTADEGAIAGLGMFAVTVTPQGYLDICPQLQKIQNVRLGVGLHPWWAADGRCDMRDAEKTSEIIQTTRYVGEIGLDASAKHVPEGTFGIQCEIFETICQACSRSDLSGAKRVLSIHSVKAGSQTLDILERSGCLDNCCCIFHWFTGSSDELNRAVRSGCFFSVNEMMLRTRRGREYVRQLPPERLLLETDLPPGQNIIFQSNNIIKSLENTLMEVQKIRGMDLSEIICKNSAKIFQPEDLHTGVTIQAS